MRRQYFGFNEKAWTDQQWLQIAKQMKNSSYTRLRHVRMIAQAQHQSGRFNKIAFASGIFFFLVLLKFPVIRIQPGFRRLGLSAGISYPIYSYVNSIAEEMKIKRSIFAMKQQNSHIANNQFINRHIIELQFDMIDQIKELHQINKQNIFKYQSHLEIQYFISKIMLAYHYIFIIYLQNKTMNQLNNKINEFHNKLRKDHLNSMMKKVRYQALHTADQDLITNIINIENHQLTNDHLQTLMNLVNRDNTNAILHLGNLIIDRFIPKEFFTNIKWVIGSNQKWSWLINVLSEIQFCTQQMFSYIIRKIISKKSNFNLQNALQVLQRSLKINKQSIINIIKINPQLIIALCNHAFDSYDKISQLSFVIFTIITSFSQEQPIVMHDILGDSRIQKMILHGLNKLQNNIRILSCQIANNFLLSKIYLQNVANRIIQLALAEKESVKLQISYYFRAFSQSISQNTILFFIKTHNLLGILSEYSMANTNTKYDTQIKSNALKSLSIISKRFEQNIQGLILKQMHRLGVAEHVSNIQDESQQVTYCNEQNFYAEQSIMKE